MIHFELIVPGSHTNNSTVESYCYCQLAMEIIAFGLPFYFIAGLVYEARAFFVFLAILIGMLFVLIAHFSPFAC